MMQTKYFVEMVLKNGVRIGTTVAAETNWMAREAANDYAEKVIGSKAVSVKILERYEG